MKLAYLAFTDKGQVLAQRIAEQLSGEVSRCRRPLSLDQWTAVKCASCDGLVYIGAAGIAVRAIAPYIKGKDVDPAVVVVDESGHFSVSLLSGHLGGANALARRIAGVIGATAVVTTATDNRGLFAVDDWAGEQDCAIVETEGIKPVAMALLEGRSVKVSCPWPVTGTIPKGLVMSSPEEAQVCVDIYDNEQARQTGAAGGNPEQVLHVVPRCGVLGIGCRRGIQAEVIDAVYRQFLRRRKIWPQAVTEAASIDVKADEEGLKAFCRARHLPLTFFSVSELEDIGSGFTSSPFVKAAVGVDNVCERSAAVLSGGSVIEKKFADRGVTMALALRPIMLSWPQEKE